MTMQTKTITTTAGPIAVQFERAGDILQIQVMHLPGKDFGLFAVYGADDFVLFEEALEDFVDGDFFARVAPDMNISMYMSGCIAAGTGPARNFRAEVLAS